MTKPTTRIVASAQLAVDDYLELIRTREGQNALCRYRDGAVIAVARRLEIGSTVYRAADSRTGIPRQMLLPSGTSDYGSFDVLFGKMVDFNCRYSGISEREAEKGALFGLGTFGRNGFDPLPRAVITGSDRWQSMMYAKVLAGLCHQSLCVENVNAAYLRNLPLGCTATFVIAHPKPPASLVNLLDATQYGVSLATAKGLTISPRFSAAIIESDNPKVEPPSSFFRIDATQVSQNDPFDAVAAREMAELQNRLLSWYFDQLFLFRQKGRELGNFGSSTRGWAYAITSFIPDTEDWNRRASEALSTQEEARLLDPALESRALVVDALLVLCHQGKSAVRIGEVAKRVNGILALREEERTIADRLVGSITTSLGLRDPNEKRRNTGYGITLTNAVKLRIHELGRSLGVPFFAQDIEPCKFCNRTAPALEQRQGARRTW